jgi:hypothetical protein
MSSIAAMKATATIGPTPGTQAPAHRRAPRQLLGPDRMKTGCELIRLCLLAFSWSKQISMWGAQMVGGLIIKPRLGAL